MGSTLGRLRPVTPGDEELLREWRQDLGTILTSVAQAVPTEDSHRGWMNIGFCDPKIRRVIYEEDGIPKGQVTIIAYNGAAHCPYLVGPQYRGQGVGKRMMEAVYKAIKGPKVAHVRMDNVPSVKILEGNGFQQVDAAILTRYGFTAAPGLQAYFREN